MAERARAQKAQERQRRDQLADDVRVVLQKDLDETWTDPDKAVLVIVPGVDAELVEVPEERIEKLRSHLESRMTAAENEIRNPLNCEALAAMHEDRDEHEACALPVINACSTCRGQCCTQGGEHAFLNRDFLAWRLLNEPDQTPQSLIDDYITRLPSHALAGSCLYHTTTGCVLPRQIRSSTCNEFVCTGISDARSQWNDQPDMASVAPCVDS